MPAAERAMPPTMAITRSQPVLTLSLIHIFHLAEQAITVLERPRALLVVERLVDRIAAVDQKAAHTKIVTVPQQVPAGRIRCV